MAVMMGHDMTVMMGDDVIVMMGHDMTLVCIKVGERHGRRRCEMHARCPLRSFGPCAVSPT